MRLSGLDQWGQNSSSSKQLVTVSDQSNFSNGHFSRSFEAHDRRRRSLAIALMAFVTVMFGAIATVALNKSVATEKTRNDTIVASGERAVQTEMTEVLLPLRDIEKDQALDPSMFTRVWRPKAGVADDAIRSFEEIRGKYARASLKAQMPFARGGVSELKPQNEVIANIPDGFRAVSINMNATTGVEGWARPGAHVDVHWIADVNGRRTSRVLVQNAKVLSTERRVDPKADANAPAPTTATLLVAERDAQKVSLAATAGSLVLHLRGANDFKSSSTTGSLTLADLLDAEEDPRGSVEGVARLKRADGSYEEFSIINGRVVAEKRAE